jgi:Starch-binding associating with outer membrane
MKAIKHIFIFSLLFSIGMISCHDQEYYQVDPNEPSTATPSLLLTSVCIDAFNRYPLDPAYASRYLTYYERPTSSVNYGWITGSFDEYNTLRQVKQMEDLAAKSNEQNYLGLGKFFRAVLFSRLTERFGDIPYSQALKATEGITKPAYDSQEDIYVGILKDLEDANSLLDPSKGTIGGDVIFNGNILQWKKAVNAFRLRTLIHLSKKESNTILNIKTQFATIVGDPSKYPLMKDFKDNAQILFNEDNVNNYYPLFNNLSVQSLVSIEEGLAKMMIDRQDPRLFSIADPIKGKTANNYANYAGVNAGLIISEQQNIALNASQINRRFVANKINEPMVLISFSEQEFLIAEAIQRGWISGLGTAASHYNAGIRGSFQFYGIGAQSIEGYLGKALVKYDPANGLKQIAEQKYVSMFCQADWEPFYEQRRTGIPTFNVGAATLNGGQIPKRWAYPNAELDNNKEAVTKAVQDQFGGQDDINQVMWLLK